LAYSQLIEKKTMVTATNSRSFMPRQTASSVPAPKGRASGARPTRGFATAASPDHCAAESDRVDEPRRQADFELARQLHKSLPEANMSDLAKVISLPIQRRPTSALQAAPAEQLDSVAAAEPVHPIGTPRSGSKRQPAEQKEQPGRRAPWVMLGLVLGGLSLFWLGVVISNRNDAAGLRALPAATRAALLTRSLNELRTVCLDPAAAAGNLRDHCVEQAQFILQFPDCGDACRRAGAVILPHAHR
jgi:hypothetical protein